MASPILGELSDKFGRKPILLYSQLGSLLGFILLATAGHFQSPITWLFIARAIDGLSGGNITVAQAYISDVTKPEERAKSFGLIIGLGFGLSFLFGPGLGGFLSRFGYSVPAYVAAMFALSSIIATFFILPEPDRKTSGQISERRTSIFPYARIVQYSRTETLRKLFFVFFFFTLLFSLYVSVFPLYAEKQLNFTAEKAGYFLALVGMLGVIWQGGLVGPLVAKVGEKNSLLLGMFANIIGLYAVLLVDTWWKLIFVAIFFSFGNGMVRPSLTSLITQAAPPDKKGGVLGVAASIESMSRIFAPILGGWIIAKLHPSWIGLVGGTFALIAFIIAANVHIEDETEHYTDPPHNSKCSTVHNDREVTEAL